MTVKQLKEELAKYPEDMDVFVAERKTEFTYGLVNSIREQTINMKEDPYGETLTTISAIVLDEE